MTASALSGTYFSCRHFTAIGTGQSKLPDKISRIEIAADYAGRMEKKVFCVEWLSPERRQKKQKEKFHLLHSFQKRKVLRRFPFFLSLPLQHILVEEAILHADGVDDAVDDH